MNAVTIDFAKTDGLVPGIVQDAKTGEMLMLGFLNEESYKKSLETGYVTFWSRSRSKLWMKGETSGNRLKIVTAATDCRSSRPSSTACCGCGSRTSHSLSQESSGS